MDGLSHHVPNTGDTQLVSVCLLEGYSSWSVTIEHPEKTHADSLCLDGTEHPASVKLAQWSLKFRAGTFPFHSGTLLQFQGQSYILLHVGSETLRVQAQAAEDFFTNPARFSSEVRAFQLTPQREERLFRRIHRQRPGRGKMRIVGSDIPLAQEEGSVRTCYLVNSTELPFALRKGLPQRVRSCFVQPFSLRQETQTLVAWQPLGDDGRPTAYPDHYRVGTTQDELASSPIIKVTADTSSQATLVSPDGGASIALVDDNEPCLRRLAETLVNPITPAYRIKVAPASILTDEMRELLAPGISFPGTSQKAAPCPRRVSLEHGQQVRIPVKIAHTLVQDLALSTTTLASLEQAKIATLGQFLEIEEEVLVEFLSRESLWEMYVVIAESGALPADAGLPSHFPEDAPPQERTIRELPQFERAFRLSERVMCELDDATVQEVCPKQVRERQGVLQVKGAVDEEWVTPKRCWVPLKRSEQMHNERTQRTKPRVLPATGFLPAEPPDLSNIGEPVFEEIYYSLTGTTYEDAELGRLHLASVTALADRLDGRQTGSIQTVWLSEKHVAQSMNWDRKMKQLDNHELRVQVNAYAQQHGAEPSAMLPPEDMAMARQRLQEQAEEAYNRVPVRSPFSGVSPLQLFVSCEELDEAGKGKTPPIETVLKVLERYMKSPMAMPPGEELPFHFLEGLYSCIKEDQRQVQRFNETWSRLFPGQPYPLTRSLAYEKAYMTRSTWEWEDEQKKRKVEKEVTELIGYRFIIGILRTVPIPSRFVIEPRRGKPILKAPGPITHTRTPNYVLVEAKKQENGVRKAVA